MLFSCNQNFTILLSKIVRSTTNIKMISAIQFLIVLVFIFKILQRKLVTINLSHCSDHILVYTVRPKMMKNKLYNPDKVKTKKISCEGEGI